MHAINPPSLRALIGMDERTAAALTELSRHTVRMYDAAPDGGVKTPEKAWLLETMHQAIADFVSSCRERLDYVRSGSWAADHEAAERDVYATTPATTPPKAA